ncbi:MAG: hypothetical protein RMK18_09260, partial [Armatimonadota bacterium]|nr:hypothetical protein [Armatimonadota bacterium]
MLGLIVGDEPTNRYCIEVLTHAGIFYFTTTPQELDHKKATICLISGRKLFSSGERAKLRWFVRQGGCLIAIGATNGLEEILGVRCIGELHEGWLRFVTSHPIGNGLQSSLRVFGGTVVQMNADGQAIAHVVDKNGEILGDAIVIRKFGQGLVIFIAPDLMHSIVQIQQGIPVTKDGKSAPDGSAPLDDGILKTED